MEKFLVSTEDCLILKAFKETNSLRSAAKLLSCDPAALARKAQAIASNYSFLQKVNNRWQLTDRGLEMVVWTEASIESQKRIFSGRATIKIATPNWFSQEVAVPSLMKLKNQLSENLNFSIVTPQKNLEMSLLDGSVDFVIADERPQSPEIAYKSIASEKLVPVSSYDWKDDFQSADSEAVLKLKPFLQNEEIKNNSVLLSLEGFKKSNYQFDNPIAVKNAVLQGMGWSILPELLTHKLISEKKLFRLPFEFLEDERKICVWWLRQRLDIRNKVNTVCEWTQNLTTKLDS